MTLFHTIILSIVEGLTEFLPVSSTGHLILAGKLLQIPDSDFYKSFEIIIQLGAILAILFLYWKKLWKEKNLWPKIIVAFLPSALFGFIFYKTIKTHFLGNIQVVLWSLFLGGLVLFLVELFLKKKLSLLSRLSLLSPLSNPPKTPNPPKPLNLKKSFLIGLFQVLSLVPGVSRSASTIVGGLAVGLNREQAVEFSFLLAIPTMFAAGGYDLLKNYQLILNGNFLFLLIGFLGSFFTALVAVKLFLRLVQNRTFIPFAIYRILLALLFFFLL